MAKFNELRTDGTVANPCGLVGSYMLFEDEGCGGLREFLEQFDFDSREEIVDAVRKFIKVVATDPYMRKKSLADENALAANIYSRYRRVMVDASKFDKYPNAMANDIWHGGYSRKKLEERTARMFANKPDKNEFEKASAKIQQVYGLSSDEMAKLHFFVEQVKAGEEFPNSLRRMLYIWGKNKKTGKTTSANMIVSILNGENNANNIAKFSSTLAYEMQVKSFAVPKISECNAVLMDECFYSDMGKTYADFKRFLTSSNGRARLPYGQEFEWYGSPNYVSTSNEPLQKFIKDWGDRRFLSVEFKGKPSEVMSFEQIGELWRAFIVNSEREKDWADWAAEIDEIGDETGEKEAYAAELAIDLKRLTILDKILAMHTTSASPLNPQNKITLKQFVSMLADEIGMVEAQKRRSEIERAVTCVFGARYSKTNYWLLSDLQTKASEYKFEINSQTNLATTDEPSNIEAAKSEKLPF